MLLLILPEANLSSSFSGLGLALYSTGVFLLFFLHPIKEKGEISLRSALLFSSLLGLGLLLGLVQSSFVQFEFAIADRYLSLKYLGAAHLVGGAALSVKKLGATELSPGLFSEDFLGQLSTLLSGIMLLNCILSYESFFAVRLLKFDFRYLNLVFLLLGLVLVFVKAIKFGRMSWEPQAETEEEGGHSFLGEEEIEKIAALINEKLVDEKLFLNPVISLGMVAKKTGTPRHQLSQVFSSHYRQSFYQLVSSLRIQHAISMIEQKPRGIMLDVLAEECGFNSKSSFNRYFKAYTGKTPSGFQKQLIEADSFAQK